MDRIARAIEAVTEATGRKGAWMRPGPESSIMMAAFLAVGLGCRDAAGPSPGVVERKIRPSVTNPAITRWDADHYVWYDRSSPPEALRLLVLLPGTGGEPGGFRRFGAVAATQGYRVIGLMYPNDQAVLNACANAAESGCMGAMRSEIVEGDDRSPHVAVDAGNSIDGRLVALLTYLADQYPSEGWDTFLRDGAARWSAIAVGGLSQGGGHAAFIAMMRPVFRVVMFGAPADGYGGAPAPWIGPGATPASRYFGLVHTRDPFPSILPNWRALGMEAFGPLTRVEGAGSPLGASHMLTTDLLPGTGSYDAAHASVFSDRAAALGPDGVPLLDAAWRYLLRQPSGDDPGTGPSSR